MKLSTRYQKQGLVRIVRGTARIMAGKVCANRSLGLKGKFERATGRIQLRIGKLQGACGL